MKIFSFAPSSSSSARKADARGGRLSSMMDQDFEETKECETDSLNTKQKGHSPGKSLLGALVPTRKSTSLRRGKMRSATTAVNGTATASDKQEKRGDILLAAVPAAPVPVSVRPPSEQPCYTFDVHYEYGTQLGLGLGVEAEMSRNGKNSLDRSKDRVVVVAVFPTRVSAVKGVLVGDYVVAINDGRIVGMSFEMVLATIRNAPRPLKITFERPEHFNPGFSVDEFHVSRDWTLSPPRDLSDWHTFHVSFGMFRSPHQLHVYECLTDYETALERAYRGQPLDMGSKMEPYTVTVESELSELMEVVYGDKLMTFFTLKPSIGLCKTLKIGSENHDAVYALHAAVRNSVVELHKCATGCHTFSYY